MATRLTSHPAIMSTPLGTPLPILHELMQRHAALTEKHYSMIGRVAAEWSYFEALLDQWCIAFAKVDRHAGVCLTSQALGLRKLDAFMALAKQRGIDGRTATDLNKFRKRAKGLSEQRNRAVHDPWCLDNPEKPIRREATARGELRYEELLVPTTELEALTANIVKLSRDFEAIAKTAQDQIDAQATSRGTSP
jgi:hypothetical protein